MDLMTELLRERLLQALKDYSLPVEIVISLLDHYHDLTGFPWWIIVASSTVAMRTALLPLLVLQLHNTSCKRFQSAFLNCLLHSHHPIREGAIFTNSRFSAKENVLLAAIMPLFIDELCLSALVLSYSPKSDQAWCHRRWVIKMIAGKCSALQDVLATESDLVEKIAEV